MNTKKIITTALALFFIHFSYAHSLSASQMTLGAGDEKLSTSDEKKIDAPPLALSKLTNQPDFNRPEIYDESTSYPSFGLQSSTHSLSSRSTATLRIFGNPTSALTEKERRSKPFLRGTVSFCTVESKCLFFSVVYFSLAAHSTPSFTINSDDFEGPLRQFDFLLIGEHFTDGKSKASLPLRINEKDYVLSYDFSIYSRSLPSSW